VTAETWLRTHTLGADAIDVEAVPARLRAGGHRVSVVIPAREVAHTIGPICHAIRAAWIDGVELVHELVVIDADSADGTATVARAAGARVVREADVRPDVPGTGKGAAMWRSLAVTTGDIVMWLDGDVSDFDPAVVARLLAPLVDRRIAYVKGFSDRPVNGSNIGGGRVSEICARPLINRYRPELAGFVHPLAGEAAGRRAVLERVPFATGYAVEIALLWDIHELVGLPGLAQVDLGRRRHRNQATADLGPMAAAITEAVLRRAAPGYRTSAPGVLGYQRPVIDGPGARLERMEIDVGELPPMVSI